MALRLGDRVRGRQRAWLHVGRRAKGPSFARLDALVAGTRSSASSAASDLRRISKLPPGPINASNPDKTVEAQRDYVEGLDRRLNYLENDIAEVEPALHGAIAAVRGAYCGQASRFRSLRRSRDARVRELAAARDAGLTARPAIHSATYPLEERLAVWQSGSAEIPVNTVVPVTSVTTILFETLERLP